MDPRLTSRWIALISLLLIALYLCWQMLQPFMNVLLWSVVLAVVFAPVHGRIERRLKSPSLAAVVSTLLVVVTILGPVTFITLAVVGELRQVAAGMEPGQGPWLDMNSPVYGPALRWLDNYVDVDQLQSPAFIREHLEAWSGSLAFGTLGLVGGVLSVVIQTFLVVFTLYYLFRDGPAIRLAVYDIAPLERRQAQDVVGRTRDVIGASVHGVVVIAAIQGALGFFIFWVLGLPSPLLWGVVMFFLSMIPMAGAFLVWAPAALYLGISGEWTRAMILTAWGVVVVGGIDNFLSPRLIGKRARMHELLIFFAVLGGLEVFGVVGLILGPVVVAVTLALMEMVRQANRPASDTVSEDGVLEEQVKVRRAS